MSLLNTLSRPELPSALIGDRLRGWVGIDVGVDVVRLAEVVQVRGRWQMKSSLELPLGSSDSEPGQRVRTLLEQGWTTGSLPCACLLPEDVVQTLVLEVPEGTFEERRLMIREELRAQPGLPNDIEFTWVPLQQFGRERVSVSWTQTSVAMSVAKQLMRYRLACRRMPAREEMCLRAVQLLDDVPEKVVVLDLRTSRFTLTAIDGENILCARPLRCGGLGSWTHRIADCLHISPSDAAALLETVGLDDHLQAELGSAPSAGPSELQHRFAETLENSVREFLQAINDTLPFAERNCSRGGIDEVVVIGPGATIPGMTELLSTVLGRTCRSWRLPGSSGEESHRVARFALAAALSSLAISSNS